MRSITLQYRAGSSDKVYQASIEPKGGKFVVNIAYGRRGTALQTGTKTELPVEWETASKIFDKIIREKKSKGYSESESGEPYQSTEQAHKVSGYLPQLLNPIDEEVTAKLMGDPAWCMQEKLDGNRIMLQKQNSTIQGINRKGLYVGLLKSIHESVQAIEHDFVLDGEMVGNRYHAFDILELDGRDMKSQPYVQRYAELKCLGMSGSNLKPVTTTYSKEAKRHLFNALVKAGAEGVVFKRLDAPYEPGKPNSGGNQLKHKFYATCSAVVSKNNDKRSVELRLVKNGVWQSAGNTTIPANQVVPPISAVVEIRYLYAMPESGHLYQPVYLGIRNDIDPQECVVSQLKFKREEE